jgi:hypothetical protein
MHYYGTRLVVGSPSSEAADHPTCVIEVKNIRYKFGIEKTLEKILQ